MDILNEAGVAVPYDADGDLFPALVMGLDGLNLHNGRTLNCMIGEIGGSAEWVVGARARFPGLQLGLQVTGVLTAEAGGAMSFLDHLDEILDGLLGLDPRRRERRTRRQRSHHQGLSLRQGHRVVSVCGIV